MTYEDATAAALSRKMDQETTDEQKAEDRAESMAGRHHRFVDDTDWTPGYCRACRRRRSYAMHHLS